MDLLDKYFDAFMSGALVTMHLAGLSWIIGISLGLTIGFLASQNLLLKKTFQ